MLITVTQKCPGNFPMDGNSDWMEVKPRRAPRQSNHIATLDEPSSPAGSHYRGSSSHDFIEITVKDHISKRARKEKKLEWSATKQRDREKRIEKRNAQRDKARESAGRKAE
jgi:hypothetical protein